MRRLASPLNQLRYFDIRVNASTVRDLCRLHSTEIYGDTFSNVVETIVKGWIYEWEKQGRFEWFGLNRKRASDLGYLPCVSEGKNNGDTIDEARGILRPVFGGMERYLLEMLGEVEPESSRLNPFYQKNPRELIMGVLKTELPREVKAARDAGLTE